MMRLRAALTALSCAVTLLLGACETVDVKQQYPDKQTGAKHSDPAPEPREQQGGLLGPEGLVLFGGKTRQEADPGSTGIGVNALLWRASLDTLSFMPLASADPFGGVIITDWYSSPDRPNERMKATVYILDRRLRADGLKVAVFRQQIGPDRNWIDLPVSVETVTRLEDAILTKAREMRIRMIGK